MTSEMNFAARMTSTDSAFDFVQVSCQLFLAPLHDAQSSIYSRDMSFFGNFDPCFLSNNFASLALTLLKTLEHPGITMNTRLQNKIGRST